MSDVYRAELTGGGPCDGLVCSVSLDHVEEQALYFSEGRTQLFSVRTACLARALELLGTVMVYRLACTPTAAGHLRFDFDGYLHAKAPEAS